MGEVLKKLSLYEVFSMLVIGALLLSLILFWLKIPCDLDVFFWMISYCIGLVFHRSLETFRSLWSEKSTCCKYGLHDFLGTIFRRNDSNSINNCKYDCSQSNHEYYKRYYQVKKTNFTNNMSLLETQGAFLRNLFWVEILYLLTIVFDGLEFLSNNKCCGVIILAVLLLFTLFSRYFTQRKVYELVDEVSSFDKDDEYSKSYKKTDMKAYLFKTERNVKILVFSESDCKNIFWENIPFKNIIGNPISLVEDFDIAETRKEEVLKLLTPDVVLAEGELFPDKEKEGLNIIKRNDFSIIKFGEKSCFLFDIQKKDLEKYYAVFFLIDKVKQIKAELDID